MMNRNKRSVVINLREDEGKAVFMKLVETADVVMENFRPGVMERLGIDYDTLAAVNPGIVFASINGVGHTGPYVGRRVYDAIIQAISGIGSLQSDPASEKPILINSLICDKITSMTAAQAIASALVAKERTGKGQRVDISMLDSALFFLWPDNMLNYSLIGDETPHDGRRTHEFMVRQTRDGYICTMPVQAAEWAGLFRALDLPNLFEDERFRTQDGLDSERFSEALNAGYAKFDTDDLAVRLEENEVPFARINPRDDVIHDPQVQAMGALARVRAPDRRPHAPSATAGAVHGDARRDLPLLAGTRRTHPGSARRGGLLGRGDHRPASAADRPVSGRVTDRVPVLLLSGLDGRRQDDGHGRDLGPPHRGERLPCLRGLRRPLLDPPACAG